MDDLERVLAGRVLADRHAAAVVLDDDHAVRLDRDRDLVRVARPSPRRSSCRRPPRRGGAGRARRSSRCTCPGGDGPPRGPRGPGCWPRCSRSRPPSPFLARGRVASARAAGWRLPRSRGPSGQALVEPPQFFVAVVLDDDAAALARAREADLGAERAAEVLLHALEVGIGEPLRLRRPPRASARGAGGPAPRSGGPTGPARRRCRARGPGRRSAGRRARGRGLR